MRALALAALVLSFSAGCREGAGKRCSSSADCKAGLYCILPIGGSPQTGGVCTDVNEAGVTEIDQSVVEDAGETSDSGLQDLSTPTADADVDGGVL